MRKLANSSTEAEYNSPCNRFFGQGFKEAHWICIHILSLFSENLPVGANKWHIKAFAEVLNVQISVSLWNVWLTIFEGNSDTEKMKIWHLYLSDI